MGNTRISTCGRLVLVALCLTWTCAIRVSGQESNRPSRPIGSEPSNHGDVSLSQPAASSDGSPFNALPLLDGVGDPAAGDKPADGDAGASATSTATQPAPFGGPWYSRPKLTGDWCWLREQFRDNGLIFDISATTYYQGLASGGLQDTFRFGGRNDYIVNVDGQKAGLWQGLFINLHGETVYGESVNALTGAVVPVNIGRAHPVFFGEETALTEVKFTQALSENFLVFAGKINTIDNVQQPFMPGRGLDAGFMNAAFVWNPILGRTMNYSTFGAGAAVLAGGQPVFTLTVYDTNNHATTSVFDNLFDNGAIIYPTVSLPTKFFGMPGHQTIWGAYSSRSYGILSPETLILFPPPRLPAGAR